jgi:hypothetical protein
VVMHGVVKQALKTPPKVVHVTARDSPRQKQHSDYLGDPDSKNLVIYL